MVHIFLSSKDLQIGKLLALYENRKISLQDEQNFYSYVLDFLKSENCFYAVWVVNDQYISALRMEPFQDGLLLEGLVTDIHHRNQGFAKSLVTEALSYAVSMGYERVYSHVQRKNTSSIHVHLACRFRQIHEYAVLIDDSVNRDCYTYVYENVHK